MTRELCRSRSVAEAGAAAGDGTPAPPGGLFRTFYESSAPEANQVLLPRGRVIHRPTFRTRRAVSIGCDDDFPPRENHHSGSETRDSDLRPVVMRRRAAVREAGAQGEIVDRLRPPFGNHQRTECIPNCVRPANLERVEAYPVDVRSARLSNYSDLHLLGSAPSESAFVRCVSCLTQRPAGLALEFACCLDEQSAGMSQFARLPSYTRAVA